MKKNRVYKGPFGEGEYVARQHVAVNKQGRFIGFITVPYNYTLQEIRKKCKKLGVTLYGCPIKIYDTINQRKP